MSDAYDVSAEMLSAVEAADKAVRLALEALSPEERADALDILRDRLLKMLVECESNANRP